MNKRQLFLILRQCTLAAVLLAVSAGSFKKDPEKPAPPEVVVLQEQDKLVAQPLAVVSSMSEEAFIDKIKEQPMSYLEAIKTARRIKNHCRWEIDSSHFSISGSPIF